MHRENRSETNVLAPSGDFAFHAAVAFSPAARSWLPWKQRASADGVSFTIPFRTVSTSFETEHVTVFAETTRSSPFGEE